MTRVSPARRSKRRRLIRPRTMIGVRVDAGDMPDRDEDPASGLHLDHDAEDLRRLVAAAQRDDDIANPADLVGVGVEHGQTSQPCQEDPHSRPGGHDREITAGTR